MTATTGWRPRGTRPEDGWRIVRGGLEVDVHPLHGARGWFVTAPAGGVACARVQGVDAGTPAHEVQRAALAIVAGHILAHMDELSEMMGCGAAVPSAVVRVA